MTILEQAKEVLTLQKEAAFSRNREVDTLVMKMIRSMSQAEYREFLRLYRKEKSTGGTS